jgi:probable F420-dependent oxidoreductase
VRIGINTPVVVQLPGVASTWEADAGPEELREIAAAADRLGLHHLTCSEHVVVPEDVAATRGGTYWDPLATLSYLAAATSSLRLVTQVLVLGYHHPLEIAKRYGTLDLLSGGRLVLGLGVGSLEDEFRLLNAPFADRGARADDALRALRASLSTATPVYRGDYYDYDQVVVEPHAVQPRVPLWIGGRTRRSLRRAVELGDGWMPFGLGLREMARMLDEVSPPADFDVVLDPGRPLDPRGDADATRASLERTRRAGASVVSARIASTSAEDFTGQLERLADLVDIEPPAPSTHGEAPGHA